MDERARLVPFSCQRSILARLFGAAVLLHTKLGLSPYPAEQQGYERQLLAARDQLGEDAYNGARFTGRALTLDQAISYALGAGD